jgi:hypothetical protein
MTPLDAAHAAMTAAPEDDAARLAYYATLAACPLFLLLEGEAKGAVAAPRVFALEDGPMVLAFDTDERLAAFAEAPVPYAALPGRAVAAALAGTGHALGINLGVADSAFVVPAAALDWLAATLARRPEVCEVTAERPVGVAAPGEVPGPLLAALAGRLAGQGGAASAVLAGVRYADERVGRMLALIDADPAAEAALAQAAGEAILLAGEGAGTIDLAFLRGDSPLARALARAGLNLDLTPPPSEPAPPPAPPGLRPPRLR